MPANREIYHFDDFTLEGYGELLGMALGVNDFVDYPNAKDFDRFVIWRHDVDMSPAAAVETALIENSLGIRAHYFFLPHSEFYNLLERENLERVRRIGDLGHSVQLHFDSGYYGVDSEERLERCLRLEADFLNEVLGVCIGAFSFHNPSAFDLGCGAEHYAGLVNTYSEFFKREVAYCSDSNGYWRHRRLRELLGPGAPPRLQVLTHPEWWQPEVMSPRQRVNRAIDLRAEATRRYYDQLLKDHGRKNIDWED
jgi:hypothetical protein